MRTTLFDKIQARLINQLVVFPCQTKMVLFPNKGIRPSEVLWRGVSEIEHLLKTVPHVYRAAGLDNECDGGVEIPTKLCKLSVGHFIVLDFVLLATACEHS